MKYIIYKLTCKINGKPYIGQTKFTLKKRFGKHITDAFGKGNRQYAIHAALRKYGPENFVPTIIARCDTLEEANHREKYYIKIFKTLAPNGYNLNPGGNNSSPSEETLKRMSEATKKTMTLERLKSMSEITKEMHRKNPEIAMHQSLRVKKKFNENPTLKDDIAIRNGSRPFKAFKKDTMELVWEGINKNECARVLDIATSAIRLCLKLKIRHINGYTFRYIGEETASLSPKGYARRKSVQNIETGEIFSSAHEAAIRYGNGLSHICINNSINRGTSAFGYHWKRPGKEHAKVLTKTKVSKRKVQNIETGIIYDSVSDALKSVGISGGGILHKAIKNGRKFRGHTWRFA